jgi:hypothetical protein
VGSETATPIVVARLGLKTQEPLPLCSALLSRVHTSFSLSSPLDCAHNSLSPSLKALGRGTMSTWWKGKGRSKSKGAGGEEAKGDGKKNATSLCSLGAAAGSR